MCQVEPQSAEPQEVEYYVSGVREHILNPVSTVSAVSKVAAAYEVNEHHLCPEVIQVNSQAEQYDETEHEHVLARPLHL